MPATTEKKCGRCREVYRGFGSTCGTCRKLPFDGLAAVNASAAGPADRNNCGVCGKRVYAMEHMSVEGVTFHKDCFRCTTCRRKLGTVFVKSGTGFFCPAHFKQITTITGGYMLGSDPSRNAKTTNLLEKLVGRSGPEDDESFDCSEDVETEVDKKVNEAEPSDCEHASATGFYPVLSKAGVLDEPNGATKESDAIKVSENTDSFIKYYTRHFLPSPVVQWTPPQTVA